MQQVGWLGYAQSKLGLCRDFRVYEVPVLIAPCCENQGIGGDIDSPAYSVEGAQSHKVQALQGIKALILRKLKVKSSARDPVIILLYVLLNDCDAVDIL